MATEPSDGLSDAELADVSRRASALRELADNAGEADASDVFASIVRTCDFEQRRRAAE